ncbi:MAG: trypsin-like peptidase domain-containing protein [Rhodovibrionaceae bacterium]
MTRRLAALCFALALLLPAPAFAQEASQSLEAALPSVVSVLPVWPGYAQGGQGAPPGSAPEGSGFAIAPGGQIATALHVVAQAERIDVRLADGRVLPAELLAGDPASDLALLRIAEELPLLEEGGEPALGQEVCALGNAYGLGLSVTCGVVSATRRTRAGFNAVEDFIQTDAAVNPGMSGGPLLDRQGRLVGLLSAIFTGKTDGNLGVNFAVSPALLKRVMGDLLDFGAVRRGSAGLQFGDLPLDQRRERAGALVAAVRPGGPAAAAGIAQGELVLAIGARRVEQASDARTALQLARPGDTVTLILWREGTETAVELELEAPPQ